MIRRLPLMALATAVIRQLPLAALATAVIRRLPSVALALTTAMIRQLLSVALATAVIWRLPPMALAAVFPPLGIAAAENAAEKIEAPFDRLFTSAAERRRLDERRRAESRVREGGAEKNSGADANPAAVDGAANAAANRRITLSGVVIRGDGDYLVWIDGHSELSAAPPPARYGKPRGEPVRVPLRVDNRSVFLKPGQVWLTGKGRIEEAYAASGNTDQAAESTPGFTAAGAEKPPGESASEQKGHSADAGERER